MAVNSEAFAPTESFRVALAASAERESLLRSPSKALDGHRGFGFDAFVKGLGASDSGVNGQVLIVMNELDVAVLLAYCLTAAGFRSRLADKDVDGAQAVERDRPDVVLLDSRLPDLRSTEIWRQMRAVRAGQRPPAVVMFIRIEDDIDPQLGLDLGPCDFVLYPLSVRDLVLRLDSLVRARREASTEAPTRRPRHYLIGPLELDADRHTALVNHVALQLSPLEMRLLAYLVEHRDRVCSRADLLTGVWGYRAGVMTRAADIHVQRLRDKLGPAASLIVTIRGTGYRLSTEFPVEVKT